MKRLAMMVAVGTALLPALAQADEGPYWVFLEDRPQSRAAAELSDKTKERALAFPPPELLKATRTGPLTNSTPLLERS